MAKKEQSKIEVKLEPLNQETIRVKLVGKTPLLMDRLPEEVMQGILDKQIGKLKVPKRK